MAKLPQDPTPKAPVSTQTRATRKRTTPPKKPRIELAAEFVALALESLATTAQTAAYLNCSEALLERRRWDGTGILYLKIGRAVRYRKSDVLAYLEGKSRTSTTEVAG
jgi:hypothetical protein